MCVTSGKKFDLRLYAFVTSYSPLVRNVRVTTYNSHTAKKWHRIYRMPDADLEKTAQTCRASTTGHSSMLVGPRFGHASFPRKKCIFCFTTGGRKLSVIGPEARVQTRSLDQHSAAGSRAKPRSPVAFKWGHSKSSLNSSTLLVCLILSKHRWYFAFFPGRLFMYIVEALHASLTLTSAWRMSTETTSVSHSRKHHVLGPVVIVGEVYSLLLTRHLRKGQDKRQPERLLNLPRLEHTP